MSGIYLTDRPVRRPQGSGSPLIRKIQRSCRMSLPEPDLALNLDVADYINEKQGGTAYDATRAIVKLINNRDSHTAVFALSLLDVLVKNCGYPVHLQISRKEFLNELVRRFPEHPPLRYSRVQRLVLTAIEEWYQTICKHAPYKDDLNYIRDMRRLLKYKGYIFPKIHSEDLAVMRPTDQLKTASEIQKEQEIAQAAKLEELIRSGRPEDLREANKLMKIMAGFKEDNVVHAKQTVNAELNKLKRKADLLNEMLNMSNESEIAENGTIEELYAALKGAQPKFQKIIEEEHDDDTLIQDLLKFNDTVNQLLNKYSLLKIGNTTAANEINPEVMAATPESNVGALSNEINLIDFGDDMGATSPSPTPNAPDLAAATANQNNIDPMMDLLGDLNDLSLSNGNGSGDLLGNNEPLELGGGISLDSNTDDIFSATSNKTASNVSAAPANTATTGTQDGSFDLLGDLTSSTGRTSTQTATKVLVNTSANLKIEFEVTRENDSTIKVKACFTNLGSVPLQEFTFSVAVPKSMQLRLQPQSDNILQTGVSEGITQDAWIENALSSSEKPLRVKWKVSYKMNGNPADEMAIFTLPNV
ncbi:ubiquitin-binding protein KNAG_0C05040 [Huiozyma naganishii CBS 8797]|uniref:VHS domain-containing protein n=1 Tax=Huiozyma naganishii (strain ATCC MYA-139 / BCRC 22969 / CBS 8797 / KCTC 17520 / NBRC 10181 / NCYC 3082 / Yp74L-3) TaxID=1071383 RepID=J7R438_HUIN7|nr:hypothetical protein KNAG_0C05040 [Kazachstania naganishii CBS 8797]CCK69605.1 hypothetical protein KNAG_0C05040 [Kazachstania naganishii CBS 8797]